MSPGEVDGFTWFSGGEARVGRGRALNGVIPAWLWKRDGTEPGTSGNIKAVFTGIFHVFYLKGD